MNDLEIININIWDDFYDDGHVPEGKKQESFMYVEEREVCMSHDKQRECLAVVYKYIYENLNVVGGVKMWLEYYDSRKIYPHINEEDNPVFMKKHPNFHFSRWEIKIENLTHEMLEDWLEHLDNTNICFEGIPLNIYSQS